MADNRFWWHGEGNDWEYLGYSGWCYSVDTVNPSRAWLGFRMA